MEKLRSEYLVGFRGICLDERYCLVMEYCEGGSLRVPPLSQTNKQRFMSEPKPKAGSAQLVLQNKLIAACKQGDEKAVKTLLQEGARVDISNSEGEHPLGAAVWGMCPDVVNALLTHVDGISSMKWKECEQHNLKHYKEIFIISKKISTKNERAFNKKL